MKSIDQLERELEDAQNRAKAAHTRYLVGSKPKERREASSEVQRYQLEALRIASILNARKQEALVAAAEEECDCFGTDEGEHEASCGFWPVYEGRNQA